MSLTIDNVKYDPYYILGVTQKDSDEQINRAFRKTAKLLHPDKLSQIEKQNPQLVNERKRHFDILRQCYEFIMTRRQDVNILSKADSERLQRNFDTNSFNEMFQKLNISEAQEFTEERIKTIDDYKKFNPEQYQILQPKFYNKDEFNKVFEYTQENSNKQNQMQLVKTIDGFCGFDTGNSCALISGHNSTQNYKSNFSSAQNPTANLEVPKDYKPKTAFVPPTKEEMMRKHNELKRNYN
jgi:curved DNA-binding protein CbpA